MHPGADIARVEDRCASGSLVCDGTGCYCRGESDVVEPSPLGFDIGVHVGVGTGRMRPADSPGLAFAAEAGASYVLPGDRFAVGLQATLDNDIEDAPGGKTSDSVTGWGGNIIGQYALVPSLVFHAGLGAMGARYKLDDSDALESGVVVAPRVLAGLTWIMERNMRRDLFLTVQATGLYVPGVTIDGTAVGLTDVTFTAAIGLALQP